MMHTFFKRSLPIIGLFTMASWMVLSAQDYIKIYSKGQKVNELHTAEIDSITFSGDNDNNGYSSTYWTVDSAYVLPTNEIDSISFAQISLEELADEIENVTKVAGKYYSQCSSVAELMNYMEEIMNVDGVEDVYCNDIVMSVKLRGWGCIHYCYPPEIISSDIEDEDDEPSETYSSTRASDTYKTHEFIDSKSICIANQVVNDSKFHHVNDNIERTTTMFRDYHFNVQLINNPGHDFFAHDIFNYDAAFIITHGWYNDQTGLHWLCTGNEIYKGGFFIPRNIIEENLANSYCYPNKINIACVEELRNGQMVDVYYTCVSNSFIASSVSRYSNPGKAIIFNVACQSLKGNANLAAAFIHKGAGIYLGYNETNNVGHNGGECFFRNMLNGFSARKAAMKVFTQYRQGHVKNPHAKSEKDPQYINFSLKGHYDGNEKTTRLSYVQTKTEDIIDESDDQGIKIKVKGSVKLCIPKYAIEHQFGFYISEKEDFESGEMLPGMNITKVGRSNDGSVTFEQTLTDKEIEGGKTYYICPYLYDGDSYCLAEKLEKFSTKGIETLDIDYAVADIAKLQGEFKLDSPAEEAGFIIDINSNFANPYEFAVEEAAGRKQAYFWSYITGLHPSNTYYFKAYVKVDGKKQFGKAVEFKTTEYLDAKLTEAKQKSSDYYVNDDGEYVKFVDYIKYTSPLMSSSTEEWGIYMDNYNNSGKAQSWPSSAGINVSEDSQDISAYILKRWFDKKDISEFKAVKNAKMGVYKKVKYSNGEDVFFSKPQNVRFTYKQIPFLEFRTHHCSDPKLTTYKGKKMLQTELWGTYYVEGSFWAKKIDMVVVEGDVKDEIGTWTIEGDGEKDFDFYYYSNKDAALSKFRFRFDMVLDNGDTVKSSNSITVTVTSESRGKSRKGDNTFETDRNKGSVLYCHKKRDLIISTKAIKVFKSGIDEQRIHNQ